MGRPLALASAVLVSLFASGLARAQTAPGEVPPASGPPTPGAPTAPAAPAPGGAGESPPGNEPGVLPLVDLQNAPPPPTNVVYLQYGVAFTAEVLSAAGPICNNVTVPCIIGSGGGVAVRAGWRGAGALYIGGAYEFSKQDPNKLLRLAILQQARVEMRYYRTSGRETEPYFAWGLGIAGYGNEWGVDTFGPAGFVGGGLESQITRRTVVGVALAYRLLYFKDFRDTSGAARDPGITQLIGLDLVLEQRDPIVSSEKPATKRAASTR